MLKIQFTKMHGIGNDFIFINCLEGIPFNPFGLAAEMSARHFSVGADGLVLVCPSDKADIKMRIINADGSEAKMCGNALRCMGKYLFEKNIISKSLIEVETLSGTKTLSLNIQDGLVSSVSVCMGKAELDPKRIPVNFEKERMVNEPLKIGKEVYLVTAVSMGNPHAVVYCDDVSSINLSKIGPLFENNPIFPEQVNTEFITVKSANELNMRVWERGCGETYACGTGACASVVSSILNGYCHYDSPVKVHLIGGDLEIVCSSDLTVTMTGPSTLVYEGEYTIA